MARLGRKERHAKRERLEAVERLTLLRKDKAKQDAANLQSLPKRERMLLQGLSPSQGIHHLNLKGMAHTKGCAAGWAGGAGQGTKSSQEKAKAKRRVFLGQGPRFAPSFMAVKGLDRFGACGVAFGVELDLSSREKLDNNVEVSFLSKEEYENQD